MKQKKMVLQKNKQQNMVLFLEHLKWQWKKHLVVLKVYMVKVH